MHTYIVAFVLLASSNIRVKYLQRVFLIFMRFEAFRGKLARYYIFMMDENKEFRYPILSLHA